MKYLIPRCNNFSIIDDIKRHRGESLMRLPIVVKQTEVKKIVGDNFKKAIKASKLLGIKKENKLFTKALIQIKNEIIEGIAELS